MILNSNSRVCGCMGVLEQQYNVKIGKIGSLGGLGGLGKMGRLVSLGGLGRLVGLGKMGSLGKLGGLVVWIRKGTCILQGYVMGMSNSFLVST